MPKRQPRPGPWPGPSRPGRSPHDVRTPARTGLPAPRPQRLHNGWRRQKTPVRGHDCAPPVAGSARQDRRWPVQSTACSSASSAFPGPPGHRNQDIITIAGIGRNWEAGWLLPAPGGRFEAQSHTISRPAPKPMGDLPRMSSRASLQKARASATPRAFARIQALAGQPREARGENAQ